MGLVCVSCNSVLREAIVRALDHGKVFCKKKCRLYIGTCQQGVHSSTTCDPRVMPPFIFPAAQLPIIRAFNAPKQASMLLLLSTEVQRFDLYYAMFLAKARNKRVLSSCLMYNVVPFLSDLFCVC